MKALHDRISSMIGGSTTPPDVLSAVRKMIHDGTAEPAIVKSVVVGLELALDIIKEEANRESSGTS